MTKTNDKPPKRIVVVGVIPGSGESLLREETEESAQKPKRSPAADGKKRVWTSPTLSESSLQEGMRKLAERMSTSYTRSQTALPTAIQIEPVDVLTEEADVEDGEWPVLPASPTPTCADPNCHVCAAKRRHDLALLNAQIILDEAYLRMRN